MIGWGDVYKVVEAMAPLYAALALGYGSVRWWRIFTAEQCEAVNRLVSYFTLPLFTFDFALHVDPYRLNYTFIAADVLSKAVIVLALAAWVRFSGKGSYCWSITGFSLSTLTNSLVVGVPLLKAMYGQEGVELVVQSSIFQAIVWLTLLLFVLELRQVSGELAVAGVCGEESPEGKAEAGDSPGGARRVCFGSLMKKVWVKLAANPNSYACYVGLAWALVASRWHLEMPVIMEESVLIMSKAGTGMAMFSMGLFMALQEKIIGCGTAMTFFGMVLRFIAGPAAMAAGSLAIGLRGDVLRIAIIQAALPQSITSFIYARDYGLHAQVLSTAVIFGMLASLPVLVGYYVVLELMH